MVQTKARRQADWIENKADSWTEKSMGDQGDSRQCRYRGVHSAPPIASAAASFNCLYDKLSPPTLPTFMSFDVCSLSADASSEKKNPVYKLIEISTGHHHHRKGTLFFIFYFLFFTFRFY